MHLVERERERERFHYISMLDLLSLFAFFIDSILNSLRECHFPRSHWIIQASAMIMLMIFIRNTEEQRICVESTVILPEGIQFPSGRELLLWMVLTLHRPPKLEVVATFDTSDQEVLTLLNALRIFTDPASASASSLSTPGSKKNPFG